jgi:hypothetical protein
VREVGLKHPTHCLVGSLLGESTMSRFKRELIPAAPIPHAHLAIGRHGSLIRITRRSAERCHEFGKVVGAPIPMRRQSEQVELGKGHRTE